MIGTVRVKRGQANYFRKLALVEAKKSGKEIQAYLVGHIVSPQLAVIDSFHYTKKYADQTSSCVRWFDADYQIVKQAAEAAGKHVIGDAHSHPNWDAVLSPTDYVSHIQEGYRIAGICSTEHGRTRLRFWVAESALPLKIEYN